MTAQKIPLWRKVPSWGWIIVAVVVLLGVFLVFREYTARKNTPQPINFSPRSEEERQSGDEKKEEILREQQAASDDMPDEPVDTTILITYGELYNSNVEVGAYVPNILEEDGTCTLTLKKGNQERTATVNAVLNAKSTDCPTMSVSESQLSPGTWSATVMYSSPTTSATSDTKEIVVP